MATITAPATPKKVIARNILRIPILLQPLAGLLNYRKLMAAATAAPIVVLYCNT
jgi:hypothetical protein